MLSQGVNKPIKISVFGDVHGNYDALIAMIKHAKGLNIGSYWFLGDMLDPGAQPAPVFEKLKNLLRNQDGAQHIWLAGNHDRALAWMADDSRQKHPEWKIFYDGLGEWYQSLAEITRKMISAEKIFATAERKTQQALELQNSPSILLAHGFPNLDEIRSCMEYTYKYAPHGDKETEIWKIRDQVAPGTSIWITGHSHRQTAWFFNGNTWGELIENFGTDLKGGTRQLTTVEDFTQPVCFGEKQLDFADYPENSLLILNPGSLGAPRDGDRVDNDRKIAKYMTLDVDEKIIICRFWGIPYKISEITRQNLSIISRNTTDG